jgi:uncharacterized OsmC-like protein
MATTTVRNGVNVDQLVSTIDAIKQQPAAARFQFRTRTEWLGGGQSRTTIQSFYGAGKEDDTRGRPHVLIGDEPAVLLGTDKGPNAVETALSALASCLAVGYAYNASAQGITLERIDFDIDGDLDLHAFLGLSETTRPGFENVRCRVRIKSNAPREQLEALRDHVEKTSPVLDIFRNPVPVQTELIAA